MESSERQLVGVLWWALLIKGIAALAFGLAAVFWPGLTLVVLVYLFSAYILISGILSIIFGIFGAGRNRMWLLGLIVGILELGVGVYAVRNPGVSLVAFVLLLGFTLLFRGVMQVVGAFMERSPDGPGKAFMILAGALSIIVGIYILLQPAVGGLAFVWALGVYLLVVGAMDIARAISTHALLDEDKRSRDGRPGHDQPSRLV